MKKIKFKKKIRKSSKKFKSMIKIIFVAILHFIKTFLNAIKSAIKTIFYFLEKCFQAFLDFLKLFFNAIKSLLIGISVLIASLSFLIFTIFIGFYFMGKIFNFAESPSFQRSRDFWIDKASFLLVEKWKYDFAKNQEELPEKFHFQGKLPNLDLPQKENDARFKKLSEYFFIDPKGRPRPLGSVDIIH
jgi:hypothetical protein